MTTTHRVPVVFLDGAWRYPEGFEAIEVNAGDLIEIFSADQAMTVGDTFTIANVNEPVPWWRRLMGWLRLRKPEPTRLREFTVTGAVPPL